MSEEVKTPPLETEVKQPEKQPEKAKTPVKKAPTPPVKVVKTVQPPAPAKEDESKIASEAQALKYFKKKFELPEGDEIAYVAEDGNVFYKVNEGSAFAHAKQKGIKLFTVKP